MDVHAAVAGLFSGGRSGAGVYTQYEFKFT